MPIHAGPCLFSWQVTTPDPERGVCGITSDRALAVHAMTEAFHATGGTHGVLQICHLSWLGPYYLYGSVIARAERIAATGAIVWHDGPQLRATAPSGMSPAVREALACMPVKQTSSGLWPRSGIGTVDSATAGGR
ncbi:hypothetical protein [Actinomadura alba]|uniref:Uncharacterized protein n=1 Tax=Actinomadura alba TaxID=406431 RepID=A0ABR7M188_9ACTN|nr:hypothetical protein [Actinomadura alba]MBC6470881.1 hypothetical protein [Actinomadura alba]